MKFFLTFLLGNSKINIMSIYVTEEDLRKNIREMRSDMTIIVKDFLSAIKELNTKLNDLQETITLHADMIKELSSHE